MRADCWPHAAGARGGGGAGASVEAGERRLHFSRFAAQSTIIMGGAVRIGSRYAVASLSGFATSDSCGTEIGAVAMTKLCLSDSREAYMRGFVAVRHSAGIEVPGLLAEFCKICHSKSSCIVEHGFGFRFSLISGCRKIHPLWCT